MEYLPYHIQFKILEQLNFNDLLSLKKTCNYFNYLIEQNKKKLAKKEFKNINIVNLKKIFLVEKFIFLFRLNSKRKRKQITKI